MKSDPSPIPATPGNLDRKAWYRRIPGPAWGLLALAVGMVLGTFYPTELAGIGKGVKDAFVFLGKAAPYIIFLTLTPSIVDMMRTGSAAKFAFWVTAAFFIATLVAAIFALVLLIPIFGLELGVAGGNMDAIANTVYEETIHSLYSPPFIAVGYSVLVALFLHFGTKTRVLGWFCRPTSEVYHTIGTKGVALVGKGMRLAFPFILFAIGVFIPTAVTTSLSSGTGQIENSGGATSFGGENPVVWYFTCLAVTVIILFLFLGLSAFTICRITGFPFKRYVKEYLVYVYPFAWATASSSATIPINLERAEKGLGVRKEVREFIIPLGATVNLDGTMIAIYVITVVAGILVQQPPTILQLVLLTVPLAIAIHGVPGIPGGVAAVAPPIVVAFMNLNPGTAAVFIAIWTAFSIGLNDQFRSGVNSANNGLLCLLFDHWYPKHFAKQVPVAVEPTPQPAAVPSTPGAPLVPELKE